MTERQKCEMALGVLAGSCRLLDKDSIEALELEQSSEAPFEEVRMGEGDFAWRGTVSAGPVKGAPMKVDPLEVKEGAVRIILSALERCGAFKRQTKKVTVK